MTALTVCTDPPGSDAWLAERRNGIGASEMAVIFTDQDGAPINPFASPHQLWLEKTGRADGFTGNYASRRGQHMESFVLAQFAQENPSYIVETPPDDLPSILAHPDHPVVRCSLDALAHNKAESIVVEAKAITRRQAHAWADGQTPPYYEVQVQAQMLVTGLENARIVVDVAGEYEERFIPRNDAVCAHLLDTATEWWQRHVVEDIEPEWNPQAQIDQEALKTAFQADPDLDPVVVPSDAADALRDAAKARAEAKVAFAVAAARMHDLMGEATAAVDSTGAKVATWKAHDGYERKAVTVKPGRTFRVAL